MQLTHSMHLHTVLFFACLFHSKQRRLGGGGVQSASSVDPCGSKQTGWSHQWAEGVGSSWDWTHPLAVASSVGSYFFSRIDGLLRNACIASAPDFAIVT